MKIALLGFDFYSPNKGCEALSYSFLNIIKSLNLSEKIEIHNFTYGEIGNIPNCFPEFDFYVNRLHFKEFGSLSKLKKTFDKFDAIFDVTFGDGFSDIYGFKWNCITNLTKALAEKSSAKFILLPQTYGPFKHILTKKWSLKIIKRATRVFTRDVLSKKYILDNLKIDNVVSLVDMAFMLPFEKKKLDGTNIGLNVSSLLFDSKYSKENKFEFLLDYREFIYDVIDYFLSKNCTIHLIAHVIDKRNYSSPENDYRIIEELKKKYNSKKVIVAPAFDNPIDAKSYISSMNLFIGSRMHATIASISAMVPTIALSYSRKFEGLYESIGYKYLFSGKNYDNKQALDFIINCWEQEYDEMKINVKKSKIIIDENCDKMKEELKKIFEGK